MGSYRLVKTEFGGMEIVGYSVGGEESVVAVPSLNVCFDIGKAPDEVLAVDYVLLTHGHMDHAAGLAYYFSQRDFREMAAGTVLLSARLAPLVENLLACWGRIDGSLPPARLVVIRPGEEFEIRKNLYAYAFATHHTSDSMGFTILDRRQKLKPEYLDLTGPQIVELKKKGIDITYPLEVPLVTYLGDTMSGDFEKLECVRKSKILIAECTFFDQDHRDRARAGRHYHFNDLSKVLMTMENEFIVLTHLSRRTDIQLARGMIDKAFPPEFRSKIFFLMDRPVRKRFGVDKLPHPSPPLSP
jgi:ribonuclease Z